MTAHSATAHLDTASEVFNLVLQNEQDNALQDAATFSRLLYTCASTNSYRAGCWLLLQAA
jgi:hypothetical protein